MSDATLADAIAARRGARTLMGRDDVAEALARMGREITARLADSNPIVLAVMHGGAFTAVELCRHLDFPYEFAYVHATRYGDELAGGELDWLVEPKPQLAGRTVLLVDDILDVGVTLTALHAALARVGAGRVYTAVFAVKSLKQPVDRPRADFVGTTVEDVYVFGCGMDYKGYWRGLPELLAVDGR